jgi:hydrogenase nickel incorporation protein HypA/HybF
MHELQVAEQILGISLKHVEGHDVNKITAVHLRIGALSDLEEEWMQRYFNYLSEGTLAENAKLKIETVPIVLECETCGAGFQTSKTELAKVDCPQCEGEEAGVKIISGREYTVMNLEVA